MRTALTAGLLIAVFAASGIAAEPPVLSADELAAALRGNGRVGPAVVNDDVDLARLTASANTTSPAPLLQDVRFRGRFRGAPSVPLRMVGGSICRLEAERALFAEPVDFQSVAIGAARLPQARLAAAWICFECQFCRANFEEATFGAAATFTGAVFAAPLAEGLCRQPVAPDCRATNFAEAVFDGPARFDRTTFRSAASFDGAEFRDTARFTHSTAAAIGFIGSRFRRDAEFRDCVFTEAYFGPDTDAARPTSNEATEFATRADFRGCRFDGVARYDGAVFAGDALFARARFSGPVASFRGALVSRSLDLRGAAINRDATLEMDAIGADAIRLDWDTLGPPVLRGLPVEQRVATLDSLSRRLTDVGESRAGLAVGFEAKRARRQQEGRCGDDSVGGCAASEAEWWMWTWPTRNGSDLTLPLAVLFALWGATAIAGVPRGRTLVPPAGSENAGPIYDCLSAPEFPEGTCCAIGPRRAGEAANFAAGLVLKLGSRRQRMAAPASSTLRLAVNLALRLVSLLGWVMIALVAGVIAASFPGLRTLVP